MTRGENSHDMRVNFHGGAGGDLLDFSVYLFFPP